MYYINYFYFYLHDLLTQKTLYSVHLLTKILYLKKKKDDSGKKKFMIKKQQQQIFMR